MKMTKKFTWLGSSAAMLILVGFAGVSQAQPFPSYIADQFDTDTTGSFGDQGWGTARAVVTWDTAQNAITTMGPNNAGSGSSHWSILWPTVNDQDILARFFANSKVLNFNQITNVSFDLMFDPSSATDGAGSYGVVEFGCIPQADGWPSTSLGNYTTAVTNGNGWIHVSIPINGASNTKFSAVRGYYVKMQQARTGANLVGTTSFWLDNVIYGGSTNLPPPPTTSLSPVTSAPGLMIVAGGSGGTYTRGLMAALDAVNGTRNFSWVGSGSTPVTYSQTIVGYPGPTHAIQSAIFLVQNGNLGDPGIDYDAANVAELSIYGNGDGTATGSFRYKTNQPAGNSQFGGTGNLGSITVPSALGKWSLTFLNDTNVTLSYVPLSGIGEVSTNLNFPDVAAVQTYFANPLTVFMGNQQNGDGNVGQSSTYSEFKIAGTTASAPIDAVWTSQTTLDTTNWNKVCNSPDNILLVHPTDKYWLRWTLPDAGFGSEVAPTLTNPSGWTSPKGPLVSTTTSRSQLISSTDLPAGQSAFFRLVKRSYTKLQVLLPGQTNAPGTALGYTGSPTPISLAAQGLTPTTITVNACDDTWHIISGVTDQIHLTTSDTGAYLPNDLAMVNGVATFSGGDGVLFQTQSPPDVTVSAKDMTSTTVTNTATSAPVTILP